MDTLIKSAQLVRAAEELRKDFPKDATEIRDCWRAQNMLLANMVKNGAFFTEENDGLQIPIGDIEYRISREYARNLIGENHLEGAGTGRKIRAVAPYHLYGDTAEEKAENLGREAAAIIGAENKLVTPKAADENKKIEALKKRATETIRRLEAERDTWAMRALHYKAIAERSGSREESSKERTEEPAQAVNDIQAKPADKPIRKTEIKPEEAEQQEAPPAQIRFPRTQKIHKSDLTMNFINLKITSEDGDELDGCELFIVPLYATDGPVECMCWIGRNRECETFFAAKNGTDFACGNYALHLCGINDNGLFRTEITLKKGNYRIEKDVMNFGNRGHLNFPHKGDENVVVHACPVTMRNNESGFANIFYCIEENGTYTTGDTSTGDLYLSKNGIEQAMQCKWMEDGYLYGQFTDVIG